MFKVSEFGTLIEEDENAPEFWINPEGDKFEILFSEPDGDFVIKVCETMEEAQYPFRGLANLGPFEYTYDEVVKFVTMGAEGYVSVLRSAGRRNK